MEDKSYKGKIKARIIELRFATSGKLVSFLKKRGETVKKSELIASLERKLLQAELDKQLGDFEKARAEFEIYNLEKGEPGNDIAKYIKSQKQAELNISVKEVELAKAKLDQADLFSPISGIIVEDSNLVSGIYITPSSNPIKILDTSSFYFEFEIDQKEIEKFLTSIPIKVEITGIDKNYSGNTKLLVSTEDEKLKVEVIFEDSSGLLLGLEGKAY